MTRSDFTPESGMCRSCRCTDDRACPGGCFWANATCTLCSRCASAGVQGPAGILVPQHVAEEVQAERGTGLQEAFDPGNPVLRAADAFNGLDDVDWDDE